MGIDDYTTFKILDLREYNELRGHTTAVPVVEGVGVIKGSVFTYLLAGRSQENIDNGMTDITPIYKSRQTRARKRTGTGEAIESGDKIYFYPGTNTVSAVATGTAGTDYYFCGWAKESALAADTTFKMEFDGTRYTEDI